MEIIITFLITFSLATDLLVLSICNGREQRHVATRGLFKTAFVFALFQFFFLTIGWFIGSLLFDIVDFVSVAMASTVFVVIGIKLIWETLRLQKEERVFDLSSTRILVSVGIASALSTILIGVGISFAKLSIYYSLLSIVIFSMFMTIAGLRLGYRYGCRYSGKWIKMTGGLLLVAAGVYYMLIYQGII